jgi:hypothetical protein
MEMDWAAFVAETNASYRSKYFAHLRRWENMRDRILSDQGISIEEYTRCENMSNTVVSMGMKDVDNLGHLHHFQASIFILWRAKLHAEVEDLLLLASLEWVACKA